MVGSAAAVSIVVQRTAERLQPKTFSDYAPSPFSYKDLVNSRAHSYSENVFCAALHSFSFRSGFALFSRFNPLCLKVYHMSTATTVAFSGDADDR